MAFYKVLLAIEPVLLAAIEPLQNQQKVVTHTFTAVAICDDVMMC